MVTEFKIKGVYSFSVYPVAELGTNWNNVTALAIMDYSTVKACGFDADAQHIRCYPSLPLGTPNDPTAYNYLKVMQPSGVAAYLGIPWVVPASISLINLTSVSFNVSGIATSDIQNIVNILAANGYKLVTITIS